MKKMMEKVASEKVKMHVKKHHGEKMADGGMVKSKMAKSGGTRKSVTASKSSYR
jgi:hypothetical protein